MSTVPRKQYSSSIDTYPCLTLPPPPTKMAESPKMEHPGTANMNPNTSRALPLSTDAIASPTSLPHSHELVMSSTATTAQSSSESTINKQGECLNRSSEASILSPQSGGWPLGSTQNYFQNSSDFYSGGGFESSLRNDKPTSSEYHELSNKHICSKFDPTFPNTQGFIATDKHVVGGGYRHNQASNITTTSDSVYGGDTTASFCADPNALWRPMKPDGIAEDNARSGNGGSSKQTAI